MVIVGGLSLITSSFQEPCDDPSGEAFRRGHRISDTIMPQRWAVDILSSGGHTHEYQRIRVRCRHRHARQEAHVYGSADMAARSARPTRRCAEKHDASPSLPPPK